VQPLRLPPHKDVDVNVNGHEAAEAIAKDRSTPDIIALLLVSASARRLVPRT